MKMKIALISDSIYPYNKGGKETRSYELASKLSKNNDVHFYTMKFWDGKEAIKKNGFYLHGICKETPLYKKNRRNIWQGIKFGISSFKLLGEDFDVLDADHMVYFHLIPSKIACMIKRKPFVVTWHEVWGKDYWIQYMGRKGILGYFMEKLSSKLPDKIIAVSEKTKNDLIKNLKVHSEKIVVIPNAIDIKRIEKIKPSKEESDIIFAGRLLSHKNVDVLIKAVSKLKNKRLIIIGDGPERESLEGLTKELGLEKNVIFKGFIEKHEDVLGLIKSSKVFVLPSSREGFGISVIEANACGKPVVTVNEKDNASKYLIKNPKNGFVCELDEDDLANVIRKSLGKKNWETKKYVEKYNWDKIIKKFEGVYWG
ncbi:glycosyltransferase family 4 protein [Patescibacteria group bacterium]|nr:glycosyltransferase family 4 protein [Patescibacteria group bacterium]